MRSYLVLIVVAIAIALIGCEPKGSAEKAGERVDEIIDNIKDGDPPLKEKGPMEKMGESIDESLKKTDKK